MIIPVAKGSNKLFLWQVGVSTHMTIEIIQNLFEQHYKLWRELLSDRRLAFVVTDLFG